MVGLENSQSSLLHEPLCHFLLHRLLLFLLLLLICQENSGWCCKHGQEELSRQIQNTEIVWEHFKHCNIAITPSSVV